MPSRKGRGPDPSFSDLTPDHWAWKPVTDLSRRGILQGLPDGQFHGAQHVDRFVLAQALANAIQQVETVSFPGGKLTISDARTLSRLAGELEAELEMQGLKDEAFDDRLSLIRSRVSQLESRVDNVEEQMGVQKSFHFDSGELRVVGFNNEEVESNTALILNFNYRVDDHIGGNFSPFFFNRFDGNLADSIQIWEAYADFDDFGVLDRARIGRQLVLIGPGMTLMDRVEGFNFQSNYGDLFLQVLFTGDLLFLAETTGFSGQRFGFYYIEEDRNEFGLKPIHVGTYVQGKIGNKLDLGIEYANYSNREATFGNNNNFTKAFLGDMTWTPTDSVEVGLTYIWQEEDFRGLAIDRDLAYHSERFSPLQDVLQAISLASRTFPLPTSKNEINGFEDFRISVNGRIPEKPWRVGVTVDRLTNNGRVFDNHPNAFTLYGARARRDISEATWIEFRLRNMNFDSPSPTETVASLGIPRIDRSEFRVQWFGRF